MEIQELRGKVRIMAIHFGNYNEFLKNEHICRREGESQNLGGIKEPLKRLKRAKLNN